MKNLNLKGKKSSRYGYSFELVNFKMKKFIKMKILTKTKTKSNILKIKLIVRFTKVK